MLLLSRLIPVQRMINLPLRSRTSTSSRDSGIQEAAAIGSRKAGNFGYLVN